MSGIFGGSKPDAGRLAKGVLLATTCLPLCVTSATAAPPAPAIDGWAGPYIGAYFTAATGRASEMVTEQRQQVNSAPQFATGTPSGPITGSMVDLFAGRNFHYGRFLVGAQVEATISSDIMLSDSGPYRAGTITAAGLADVANRIDGQTPQLTFKAGLIGRAGYLAHPNLLLYGLVGFEFAHFLFPDADGSFGQAGTANRNFALGYTAGAGVEARVDDHWSIRAEYRYSHFGTGRYEPFNSSSANTSVLRNDHVNMQAGKVGLVYRFGESGPLTAMAAMPRSPQQVWADSWAGPYAGIYFGGGAGRGAENYAASTASTRTTTTASARPPFVTVTTTSTFTNVAAPLTGDVNGSTTDAFLGYNWRHGKFVGGVQVEGSAFSDVGWKGIGLQVTTGPTGVIRIENTRDVQYLRATAGAIARAGFLATPDLLLYGLGGVEFGHFVYGVRPNGINSNRFGGDDGKWVTGYTAGAGGELRLNDHWSLRGEYRYLYFDLDRYESQPQSSVSNGGTTVFDGTSTRSRNAGVDFHTGKIGIVYKFGGAGPASAMAAMPSSVAARWADGWAGPYFGAYFGAGAGRARTGLTDDVVTTVVQNGTGALAGSMSGTQVDLFAGYNMRSDRFVLGGQIEGTQFSDAGFKTSGQLTYTIPAVRQITSSTSDHSQRLRSVASVVGRAGFLATPNLLLYGLGGVAFGHFTYPDFASAGDDPDGKWTVGYTAGVGAEVKIARHWSLRGEYRYMHFDTGTAAYSRSVLGQQTSTDTITYRTSADFHLAKIGLAYRIGGDPASAMAALPGAETCCDRWSGVSAGVYAAAGTGGVQDTFKQDTVNSSYAPPGVLSSQTTTFASSALAGNMQGGMVDLFAGYNWRGGNVVIGGQAEASLYADVGLKSRGALSSTQTTGGNSSRIVLPLEIQQTLRSRAGLIARAGFLATPNLLLYGLAGAEFGHFAFLDGVEQVAGQDRRWVFGFTAGAGAEMKLTDRWSLRGEYRHARYTLDRVATTTFDFVTPVNSGGATSTTTIRTRADFNLGKIGVAYNFCYCE